MTHFAPNVLAERAAKLAATYRSRRGPVAYIDETYQLTGDGRFYAVAASVIADDDLDGARTAILNAYNGEAVHASAMWKAAEKASLAAAITVMAALPVQHCIIYQTDVAADDAFGETARSSCMANIMRALCRAPGVRLYVADSRGTPDADRVDTELLRSLRESGEVEREVTLVHRMPSEEPLIALADVAGWTHRQQHLATTAAYLHSPLASKTKVHYLSVPSRRAEDSPSREPDVDASDERDGVRAPALPN